jgi:glutathione S-transferase
MYTLHIANKNYSSCSLRPWVLMKTLGIPFEERVHYFPADRPSYPDFVKFSPSGLVPVLNDGETVVWESLAIVEYLAERHPGVWPADAAARAWARSASAEMHGGFGTLRNRCTMNVGLRVKLHERGDNLARDVERMAALWADGLGRFGGPFLGGSGFSAVDAMFAPVAFRAQTYGVLTDPTSAAYVQRLLALSAMREWEAAALKETEREPGHEGEARATGTLTADLRATA